MSRRARSAAAAFAVATALLAAVGAPADAAEVPANAVWSQASIRSAGGVSLHADVLRPKGLAERARTPVILSIGPYFNHTGQTGPLGPIQETTYDPVTEIGPSDRFFDFLEGARLMERGYTFVMVDLRGYGGSNGCPDWVGPGEQADVKAAVEWAARQPWSTGRVGMYGKSYDASTGLAGMAVRPDGLAAVVAQEPVYDMYRYLFADGVRFPNSLGTPALYDLIAATPGAVIEQPSYNLDSLNDPACLASFWLSQQDPNHGSAYWRARDLIAATRGARTPLFLTQGFLENNTKPDGSFDLFNGISGPRRAWFGMWDHVRGNEVDGAGRLKMGRKGFFDETMRFFDHHVRGVPLADAATDKDPPVAVQTSDGSWRSEASWPPADAVRLATTLRTGSYDDDALALARDPDGITTGIWTISQPLPHEVHLAGVPTVELDLRMARQGANLVVDLFAIAPDGKALNLGRGARLASGSGPQRLEIYGNDWRLAAGHRLGVLVTPSNFGFWLHVPSMQRVDVRGGRIELPFLKYRRSARIQGDPSIRLEEFTREEAIELPADLIAQGTSPGFAVPPALTDPPPPPAPRRRQTTAGRLMARIAADGRRVVVYGSAPSGARVTVALRRGARTVGRRTVTARNRAFRTSFRVRTAGRYRAIVRARRGSLRLSARPVSVRVRAHGQGR